MKISKRFDETVTNRVTNLILALMAGILAVLCAMSILQH